MSTTPRRQASSTSAAGRPCKARRLAWPGGAQVPFVGELGEKLRRRVRGVAVALDGTLLGERLPQGVDRHRGDDEHDGATEQRRQCEQPPDVGGAQLEQLGKVRPFIGYPPFRGELEEHVLESTCWVQDPCRANAASQGGVATVAGGTPGDQQAV